MATASDGDNVARLVKKKNANDPVWAYFGFSPDFKRASHYERSCVIGDHENIAIYKFILR